MYLMFVLGVFFWFIYGYMIGDMVILLFNIIIFIFVIVVFFYKVYLIKRFSN